MAYKKIGIDFHGVINTNPDFFKKMIDCALQKEIEVHIISGGPRESIEGYLREHQIAYSFLWCIYDYYEQNKEVKFFADGSFHIADELWNTAKARYCEQHGICLHIDDSTIYGRCFETPYCLYDERRKVCRMGKKVVDFSSAPEKALDELIKLCAEANAKE